MQYTSSYRQIMPTPFEYVSDKDSEVSTQCPSPRRNVHSRVLLLCLPRLNLNVWQRIYHPFQRDVSSWQSLDPLHPRPTFVCAPFAVWTVSVSILFLIVHLALSEKANDMRVSVLACLGRPLKTNNKKKKGLKRTHTNACTNVVNIRFTYAFAEISNSLCFINFQCLIKMSVIYRNT